MRIVVKFWFWMFLGDRYRQQAGSYNGSL